MCVKGVFKRSEMCASVGGILKKDGGWVRGVGGNIGLADPETAEMWAIFYGLKMAWEREKTSVVVFSESMAAINAINAADPAHPMAMLIDMIICLLRESWDFVEIQPTHPSANAAANVMAQYCLSLGGGVEEFAEAPSAIKDII